MIKLKKFSNSSVAPMNGDTAHDLQANIFDHLFQYIYNELKSNPTESGYIWALIGNLLKLGDELKGAYFLNLNKDSIIDKCIELANERLKSIKSDRDFINSWKDPKEFENKLDEVIDKFYKFMLSRSFDGVNNNKYEWIDLDYEY